MGKKRGSHKHKHKRKQSVRRSPQCPLRKLEASNRQVLEALDYIHYLADFHWQLIEALEEHLWRLRWRDRGQRNNPRRFRHGEGLW